MKRTNTLHKVFIACIVTFLTLTAAWQISGYHTNYYTSQAEFYHGSGEPTTYTYDGKQYAVGVGVVSQGAQLVPGIDSYQITEPSNYKYYRLGGRQTPYTYTSVDVPTKPVTIVEQVFLEEPVETVAFVEVSEEEPIHIEAQAEYVTEQITHEYPDEYEVEHRATTLEEANYDSIAPVQDIETINYEYVESENIEHDHLQESTRDINHYHNIDRYHTHNYEHKRKHIHHHYYNVRDHHKDIHRVTDEHEQIYYEPTYETLYEEPDYLETPVTLGSRSYEVSYGPTYSVPVQTVSYQAMPAPAVQPIAYRPLPEWYYSGANAHKAYYPSPNWRYASSGW